MARFSRIDVALTMHRTGLVPVFFDANLQAAQAVVTACHAGGARCFEFTNRGERAHEVFGQLAAWASDALPDMMLGVGSVMDPGTASLYLQLGANFVVSPILDATIASVCNRRKVLWSPGCGTLSEISRAEELGAEVVKIFPGSSVGGPSFVKAVRGPCPWTSIMPTGGVAPTEDNLSAWFEAGVWCVGMGSKLFQKSADGSWDLGAIEAKTRDALAIIQRVRAEP